MSGPCRRCAAASFSDALLDSRRREELGTEGLSFWETNYSPDAVYPRWKRLLDDVLSGHIGNRY